MEPSKLAADVLPDQDSGVHHRGGYPYRKPVLTLYGNVRELTQSIGVSNGDGGQNMMP